MRRRIDRSGVGRFEHHIEGAAFSQYAEQDGFTAAHFGDRAAEFSDRANIDTVHFLDKVTFVKPLRLGEAPGLDFGNEHTSAFAQLEFIGEARRQILHVEA
jgi:hypothetical protein